MSYEKKNGFKKTLFLNLRFLKMGKIGNYIFKKKNFADSHKIFPQLYGKNTKIAFKNFKIEILLGKTEPAILFAPTV